MTQPMKNAELPRWLESYAELVSSPETATRLRLAAKRLRAVDKAADCLRRADAHLAYGPAWKLIGEARAALAALSEERT